MSDIDVGHSRGIFYREIFDVMIVLCPFVPTRISLRATRKFSPPEPQMVIIKFERNTGAHPMITSGQ
jgi:uncharacterized protein (UPF0254 family)